jgi:hypothetical protein
MSDLLKINVNDHTERKNGLSYLSWAWAWAEVLKIDPQATWEAVEFDGFPASFAPDGSALVKTVVTIKGHTKSCWLPVMNHRNQAIKNPDAFAINTAIVRCLTKCISMHGLGLYIYAGEDLPEMDTQELDEFAAQLVALHDESNDMQAVHLWYSPDVRKRLLGTNEAIEYVWSQLRDHSALRSAIKANKPQLKEAA